MNRIRWLPIRAAALCALSLVLPPTIGAPGAAFGPEALLAGDLKFHCPVCGSTSHGSHYHDRQSGGGRSRRNDDDYVYTPPPPPPPPPVDPAAEARAALERQHAEANGLNADGVAQYNAGRWQQAIDLFSAALAKWPENQVIRTNLQNARDNLAAERLRNAAGQASAELRAELAGAQLRELESLGRQTASLDAARADAWRRRFEDGERERAEVQAAKEVALERMSPLPGLNGPARLKWEAGISNPQIADIMRGLREIQVPAPIPAQEVSLDWQRIAVEHGTEAVDKASEYGFLAWDLFGKIGSKTLACKVVVITGKTAIAGEDAALVHVMKENAVYEQALAYLKDPVNSKDFVEVVRALKERGEPPAKADPAMVRAARAISDPKLGSSGRELAVDAMLSPEALSAMWRKACLEAGGELLGMGTEGVLGELTRHGEVFEAARLERRKAQALLRDATDAAEREQLKKTIAHANYILQNTYRFEKAGPTLGSFGIGKIVGAAAEGGGEKKP